MSFNSPASQFDAVIAEVGKLTQTQIVAEAKRLHGEVMRADPKPVNFTRHVDGREAPEEAVRPGGIIVYDYNRLDLIAKDALRLLRDASPVKSGAYRDAHRLYLNLNPVDDLKAWKEGDEVSLTNTVPYSRVIELGKRGSKTVKFSMPPHIYERVAKALRREYSGAADIQFTFRAVLGGGQVDQLQTGPTLQRRNRKTGRFMFAGGTQGHNKADVRWPTITINPAGSFYSRAGR